MDKVELFGLKILEKEFLYETKGWEKEFYILQVDE